MVAFDRGHTTWVAMTSASGTERESASQLCGNLDGNATLFKFSASKICNLLREIKPKHSAIMEKLSSPLPESQIAQERFLCFCESTHIVIRGGKFFPNTVWMLTKVVDKVDKSFLPVCENWHQEKHASLCERKSWLCRMTPPSVRKHYVTWEKSFSLCCLHYAFLKEKWSRFV